MAFSRHGLQRKYHMKKIIIPCTVILFVLLLVALAVGCQQQTTPALPKSGEWTTTTEFGELGFTVSPDSTGITKISFDFAEFECGGIQMSGGMSIESETPWPITDGQFTVDTTLGPMTPWDVVIHGEFDQTGTQASGTWEISSAGTVCSGTWESSPTP